MDTNTAGLENVSRCKCGIMLGIFVKFRGSTWFLVHKTPRISIIWVLAFLFYMASWLKKGKGGICSLQDRETELEEGSLHYQVWEESNNANL